MLTLRCGKAFPYKELKKPVIESTQLPRNVNHWGAVKFKNCEYNIQQ